MTDNGTIGSGNQSFVGRLVAIEPGFKPIAGKINYMGYIPNFKNYIVPKFLNYNGYGPTVSDFDIDHEEIILLSDSQGECKFIVISENPMDVKFKQICKSLIDTKIHNEIKKIIIDYGINHIAVIDCVYPYLLDKIFNNELNDFTIKFSDNNYFDCNRLILKTNKYFKNLLDDCDDSSNEMLMITDYETTILLIKMLYNRPVFSTIYPSDFCKIFELMDVMLMDEEYIVKILGILKNKLDSIINFELKQNNFENINLLIEHLKNIFESSEYLETTKNLANNIYNKIYDTDYGDKIFYFNDWQNLFSNKYKMDAIINVNKLELFNVANINFTSGIKFFKEYDFGNDCYTDIEHLAGVKHTTIYFKYDKPIITIDHDVHSVIVLNEWFSTFNVDIYKRINVIIEKIEGKWITLKVDVYWPGEISANSQILLGYDISQNTENIFFVEEIIKCFGEKTKIVNKAIYTTNLPIFYKIKLNKELPLKYNDMLFSNCGTNQPVWTLTQIRNKIELQMV